ncbi:DUF2635 domain-containing protein [Serratia fonticola]|nr:DUF2635 domain-containing protein [Serratia fonticola]
MTVKAASGLRVPMEGSPREYITDTAAVSVARTPYYLRRLAEGDLIEATEAPAVPASTEADASTQGGESEAQQEETPVSEAATRAGKKKAPQESAP